MANLIVDDSGRPIPQHMNQSTGNMEATKGTNNAINVNAINEVTIKPAAEANQTDPLKVKIVSALPAGTNKIGSMDIGSPIPTGSNFIGSVGVQGAIPPGTNTIGKIDINLPRFIPLKVTLVPDTPLQIKATAGYVSKIETELTDVILRNNTTEVWGGLGKVDFSSPVYLDTNITLLSTIGGVVYISYI